MLDKCKARPCFSGCWFLCIPYLLKFILFFPTLLSPSPVPTSSQPSPQGPYHKTIKTILSPPFLPLHTDKTTYSNSLLPLPLPPNPFFIPIHQIRIFLPRPTPSFNPLCKRQALHMRIFLFLDIIIEPARSTGSAPSWWACCFVLIVNKCPSAAGGIFIIAYVVSEGVGGVFSCLAGWGGKKKDNESTFE